MQNIQKKKKQYFKDFLFKRVDSVPSLPILYTAIVFLNILCDIIFLLQYALQDSINLYNFATVQLFYINVAILVGFFIITGLSTFSVFFAHIWVYYLMIVEALTMFYIRNLVLCVNSYEGHICYGEISFKIASAVISLIYVIIIIICRGNTYFPFQNVKHLFSKRQQFSSLFLLIFRIFIGVTIYHDLIQVKSQQKKAIFILAFILFWKSRNSGQMNQYSRKIWDIYYYSICWSCFSLFVADYLSMINDTSSLAIFSKQLTMKEMIIYFWVYTYPFAIAIPICSSNTMSEQFWMNMFGPNGHQLETTYDKDQIYIICNQSYQKIDEIKKSQLKFKDSQYRSLWNLIKMHNQKCVNLKCPLHQLQEYKGQTKDDGYQQKKFSKTLRICLQYIRVTLQRLKQKYPDNLQVQLQIAYFHLICLRNKQKGMLLYNQFNRKKSKKSNEIMEYQSQQKKKQENRSQVQNKAKSDRKPNTKNSSFIGFSKQYAVHYLKNKIDKVFSKQQKQSQTNVDNQISEFRQKIQISVTMLAQFWSILADPKCNLKKMYDLTNVLFPLKLSIEQDWQRVKSFKNVQTYAIYAKYLIRMFNDKQKGIKIIQEAKKVQYQLKNKQQAQLDQKGGEVLDENGIVFMQYDGKNSGIMFQVNMNCQKIFGYNKKQLCNKKVNQIMPKIYAKEHDKILQNYLQTSYSTMMNKQRHIWGRMKDGFLIPIVILIKPILSYYTQTSNSEVYASIKRQQYLRQVVAIIIDKNQIVQEYTTTALRIFPLLEQKHKRDIKCKAGIKIKKQVSDKKISNSILNISDLIPNFKQIKHKILIQNQQYEYKTQRQIKTNRNDTDNIIEQCNFNLQITEIIIRIQNKIGYLIKFTKIGHPLFIRQQKSTENEEQKQLKIINQNDRINFYDQKQEESKDITRNQVKFKLEIPSNNQKRRFVFSYDMAEKQRIFQNSLKQIEQRQQEQQIGCQLSQTKKRLFQNKINKKVAAQLQAQQMKYIGGYTKSSEILQKFKTDTLSTFKAQLKVSQMQYQQNRVDYSIGIKTKRLYDKNIRQLRQQSQIQYKKNQEQQEKSQLQSKLGAQIKPSQVALILSKGSKNNFIKYLRFLTVLLLVLCSVVSIVELIIIKGIKQKVSQTILNFKLLNQIKTQVLNINFFVNYLGLYKGQNVLAFHNFHETIDQLDYKINQFTYHTNTQLVYSDRSKDSYFIGFALNKLISEANSLTLNDAGLIKNNDDSTIYFVRYNTVNGISISLTNQYTDLQSVFQALIDNNSLICLIFIGVVSILSLIILIIKNILLRLVIRKKTQILEVFFQIPRLSCNIIQKQCQIFILRIASDNEEEQLQVTNNQQFEEANKGTEKVQKKRTIVGQENTIMVFSLVSVVFLVFLLTFQISFQAMNQVQNKSVKQVTWHAQEFFNIQYKMLQVVVNMESYAVNSSIPLQNSYKHQQIVTKQKTELLQNIANIYTSFFKIMSILDKQFENSATTLFYESLCMENECIDSTTYPSQIKQGLNIVLQRYLLIIKHRYQQLISKNTSQLIQPKQDYLLQKIYANAMKLYWRKFTQLICDSIKRFNTVSETINIWVLVTICVINLVVVLIGWLKYYHNLQAKIVATQYILTFIPINEINKNKKIAQFIKKQIITRK